MNGGIIVVGGLIAAGKSTFGRELATVLNALYLTEPDEQENANPYLSGYYNDPKGVAFTMQIHMLQARYARHQAAQWYVAAGLGNAVMDSSYHFDLAFAHLQWRLGFLSSDQLSTYRSLYHGMTANILYPSVCVYLDVDPSVAYDRVHSRLSKREGRKCEEAVSLSYLTDLRTEMHEALDVLGRRGASVLVVPWNEPRETSDARSESIAKVATTIRSACVSREWADLYTRTA